MGQKSLVITRSHNSSNEIQQCLRMSLACGEMTLATRLNPLKNPPGRAMRHLINASHLQEKSSVSLLSAGIMSRAAYSRKAVSCDNHHAGVVAFLESLAEPLFMRLAV